MEVGKTVRVCPKCNHRDIVMDFPSKEAVASGETFYKCVYCGFGGASGLFQEVPAEEMKFDSQDKGRPKVKILNVWKYVAPVAIIASVLAFFAYPQPQNMLGLIYALPVAFYLLLHVFARKYVEEFKMLRTLGFIVVLFTFIAPIPILLMLMQ